MPLKRAIFSFDGSATPTVVAFVRVCGAASLAIATATAASFVSCESIKKINNGYYYRYKY